MSEPQDTTGGLSGAEEMRVEAVARALCDADGYDPDQLEPGDALGIDGYNRKDEPCHFMWRNFTEQAHAALEALRALPLPAKQPQDDRGTEEIAREIAQMHYPEGGAANAAHQLLKRQVAAALRSDRAANKARIGETPLNVRIEAAARALDWEGYAFAHPTPGHGPGECPDCDDRRAQFLENARKAIEAAFPEFSLPAIKQESGNG